MSASTAEATSQNERKADIGCWLRLQTPSGALQRTLLANSHLEDVVSFVQQESGKQVGKLEIRMPRKVIWQEAKGDKQASEDGEKGLERTVEEAVGVGSAVLVVTFSAGSETGERLS